ncbi:MAG: FMN-binding protein [bacterium]
MQKCFKITFIILITLIYISSIHGQLLKTQKEALQQAFPENAEVTRKVLFLTDKQVEKIQKLARVKIESKMLTYYIGSKNDTIIGYAFFARDIVRTKLAAFLVVVNPDSSVKYIDILAFHEPFDYLPTANWLKLFDSKKLKSSLWPNRDIHGISGATLTVRTLTLGVRKILAAFQIAVTKEDPK